MRWPGFKIKALTLSYDDGVIYDKQLIEIMSKYGIKGTFNINSGLFAKETGGVRMTRDEAYKLYTESGNEVAVHGVKHLALDAVNSACAVNDVLNDRIALENMFGTLVQGMAYAFGSYDQRVLEILKNCGINYARTTASNEKCDIPEDWLRLAPTCHHKHPRLMELARDFLAYTDEGKYHSTPRMFYLWGHSYEFNDANNWNVIEDFCELVGGKDDVWYATNGEIYDYVAAYDSLRYSADGTLVYNPSAKDVYIAYYTRQYVIPAGGVARVAPKV